jgi:putative hemolysin
MATQAVLNYREPFQLPAAAVNPLAQLMLKLARPLVEWLLAFPELNQIHRDSRALEADHCFSERVLDVARVKLRVDESELARIPDTGPLIVVSNHPFGALDGLALIALLRRRRPDVKILINHLLSVIPEMADVGLFVDPFGGKGAQRRNLAGVRGAIRFVQQGGTLAVFPAGEVSSLRLQNRSVSDGPWGRQIGALARSTGAPVLPIHFAGRNSGLFQLAGLISPRLRTLLLPREVLKKRGGTIEARIGNLVTAEKLKSFDDDTALADYLRVRTYVLAARQTPAPAPLSRPQHVRAMAPVAPSQPAQLIAAEIGNLPADQTLATSGDFSVMYGTAAELPWTLKEIGRLRELTFRRVGEATGKPLDLDQFDQTYLHLFVWNSRSQEVVGAYRMGLTDEILQQHGVDGLYTSTLFRYRDELLKQLGPAIELGRSFVRPEYQREYAPLNLLWRGIALFAARCPKYRMLFGPVSISNEYQSFTRQLLIEFLKSNTTSSNHQKLVIPRNPPRFGSGRRWEARLAGTVVRSIEAIDELVGEIESDRSGMPVLLRQYLKLNAKLLGFNVDPEFGNVLDGLMLVDLTKVQRAILTRYMGREPAARFLSHHAQMSEPARTT